MENSKDNKSNESEVSKFFSYFEERIQDVDKLQHNLFKKILYFTMLDTLSKCAYPKVNRNKERFVKFIEKFSNWGDGNRVSACQLSFYLKAQIEEFTQLRTQIDSFIKNWNNGEIVRPEKEPFINDLTLGSQDYRKIEEFTYKALLWKYRCFLIHEFREPGYPMEISDDGSTPYYIGMKHINGQDISDKSWELTFSLPFIKNLLLESLKKLQEYCKKEDINPYHSYKFSSSWFE